MKLVWGLLLAAIVVSAPDALAKKKRSSSSSKRSAPAPKKRRHSETQSQRAARCPPPAPNAIAFYKAQLTDEIRSRPPTPDNKKLATVYGEMLGLQQLESSGLAGTISYHEHEGVTDDDNMDQSDIINKGLDISQPGQNDVKARLSVIRTNLNKYVISPSSPSYANVQMNVGLLQMSWDRLVWPNENDDPAPKVRAFVDKFQSLADASPDNLSQLAQVCGSAQMIDAPNSDMLESLSKLRNCHTHTPEILAAFKSGGRGKSQPLKGAIECWSRWMSYCPALNVQVAKIQRQYENSRLKSNINSFWGPLRIASKQRCVESIKDAFMSDPEVKALIQVPTQTESPNPQHSGRGN